MARPRPIDYRQEMRDRDHVDDRTQDWQALRGDLLDLLNEVDRQEQHYGDTEHNNRTPRRHAVERMPSRDGSGAQARDRHRRALNSVAETLERFSERGDSGVSSAIDQIRERHNDVPARRRDRTEDFQGSVREMSSRLERLGHNLANNNYNAANDLDVARQLADLTQTIELLAGAVGESGQVKRLESQIAGLTQLVQQAPDRRQSELNERLDRLASTVEQISDAQYHLSDRPVAMLEEMSDAQGRGFDAIETGVRGIYDRIDALEQNVGVNPGDIERLTSDMSELVRMVQSGTTEKTLLSKIDALNARMNGIEDGTSLAGVSSGDVETLRDAVRDAVEPRFTEIKSIIDTLESKMKSGAGQDSAGLEGQISQLIARLDQTGGQLAEMAKFRSENPDASPDLGALAEMVAERTSKAVSQSTRDAIAQNGSTDERVHKSIAQVDKRLARLEDTLKNAAAPNRKVGFVASKPPAGQNKPNSKAPQAAAASTASKSAQTSDQSQAQATQTANKETYKLSGNASDTAQNRAAQPATDPADAMRANPSDDTPLIDRSFGATEQQPAPASPTSSIDKTQTSRDPIPRETPAGFDPLSVEPPRQPRSSFADDSGSTFSASEAPEPKNEDPQDAPTNRNTFIEAARRAAQRNNVEVESESPSIVSRMLGKFRREKDADVHIEPEEIAADASEPPARGLRARLTDLARKNEDASSETDDSSYHMADAYADAHDDDDIERSSFLSRHRRPLMLAGLVILVSLLAINLVQRRAGSETPAPTPASAAQSEAPPPAPAGLLNQPLLDPQPTGSVDPFVRQIPGAASIDQPMTAPLAPATGNLTPSMETSALETTAMGANELPDIAANAPLKHDLPAEALGPLALREAAAKGDPRAQFEIAAILSEGRATEANHAEAAIWYERAAAQGFAPAEYRIGNIYEHGLGVTKDIAQAKIWYERAAMAGNRMSMHNLAALYASGAMGKQQFTKAAEWFEQAAGLGLTDSQFNLGMLHARGLGVPQDMATSYKWFSLAAAQGDDGAAKARDDVARSLDTETISRLRTEIAGWRPLEINMRTNFAPIGTWTADFNPGNTIGDQNVIKEVQSALNRLGFDVGTPDGLMGPRTRDAIAAFERDTGMSESGAVNPRLLAVLGSQPV